MKIFERISLEFIAQDFINRVFVHIVPAITNGFGTYTLKATVLIAQVVIPVLLI